MIHGLSFLEVTSYEIQMSTVNQTHNVHTAYSYTHMHTPLNPSPATHTGILLAPGHTE